MNMDEMLRSTEDRTGWQQLVRSVTNPRIEDGWSQVKSIIEAAGTCHHQAAELANEPGKQVAKHHRRLQGDHIPVSAESRSRIEYVMSTNNIIVFDSYFNLTNKSNVIDRL